MVFYFVFWCKILWEKFENFVEPPVLNDINIILSSCGFDTALSIASIKEENIIEIENFFTNYLNNKRDELKTLSEYETLDSTKDFSFKPGHRVLIIGLSKRFETFINSIGTKNLTKDEVRNNKSEKELKSEILKKIESFVQKQNFIVKLNITNDISDFKKKRDSYSCKVKCPYCAKCIVCTYRKYWLASNLEAHLKVHTAALAALNASTGESDK